MKITSLLNKYKTSFKSSQVKNQFLRVRLGTKLVTILHSVFSTLKEQELYRMNSWRLSYQILRHMIRLARLDFNKTFKIELLTQVLSKNG